MHAGVHRSPIAHSLSPVLKVRPTSAFSSTAGPTRPSSCTARRPATASARCRGDRGVRRLLADDAVEAGGPAPAGRAGGAGRPGRRRRHRRAAHRRAVRRRHRHARHGERVREAGITAVANAGEFSAAAGQLRQRLPRWHYWAPPGSSWSYAIANGWRDWLRSLRRSGVRLVVRDWPPPDRPVAGLADADLVISAVPGGTAESLTPWAHDWPPATHFRSGLRAVAHGAGAAAGQAGARSAGRS